MKDEAGARKRRLILIVAGASVASLIVGASIWAWLDHRAKERAETARHTWVVTIHTAEGNEIVLIDGREPSGTICEKLRGRADGIYRNAGAPEGNDRILATIDIRRKVVFPMPGLGKELARKRGVSSEQVKVVTTEETSFGFDLVLMPSGEAGAAAGKTEDGEKAYLVHGRDWEVVAAIAAKHLADFISTYDPMTLDAPGKGD